MGNGVFAVGTSAFLQAASPHFSRDCLFSGDANLLIGVLPPPIRRLAFPGLPHRNSCQLCFEILKAYPLGHLARTHRLSTGTARSRSCGEKVRLAQFANPVIRIQIIALVTSQVIVGFIAA
jgi:hypothetical protein